MEKSLLNLRLLYYGRRVFNLTLLNFARRFDIFYCFDIFGIESVKNFCFASALFVCCISFEPRAIRAKDIVWSGITVFSLHGYAKFFYSCISRYHYVLQKNFNFMLTNHIAFYS